MLTARGDAMDRIVGLEMGADDYLPKPFEPRELLARLQGHPAPRARQRSTQPADVLRFGRLEIDQRRARGAHRRRRPPADQLSIRRCCSRWPSRPAACCRATPLMDLVKGETLEAFDRSIDVHISRIRAAIEDNPKKPRRIITVRGAGYVFAKAQD